MILRNMLIPLVIHKSAYCLPNKNRNILSPIKNTSVARDWIYMDFSYPLGFNDYSLAVMLYLDQPSLTLSPLCQFARQSVCQSRPAKENLSTFIISQVCMLLLSYLHRHR